MGVLILLVLGLALPVTFGKERLTVIFERDSVTYANPKYVIVHDHGLSRANRSSPLTYGINATILHPWYNNVTAEFKGYENRNNEYKQSFINFRYLICDLYDKPNFILKIARNFGNLPKKCPMQNSMFLKDLTVRDDQIPPFFPKSRWMMQLMAYTTKDKIKIMEVELYFEITTAIEKSIGKKRKH